MAGALQLWQILGMPPLGTWERMVWGWRARAFRGEKSKEGAGSGPSPRLGDRGHTRELLLISVAPGQAFLSFYRGNHFQSLPQP